MEHQTRLNISKLPCKKPDCRHQFQVLVKSVVVGIMAEKGLVPSFVFIGLLDSIIIYKMSTGR